MKDNRTNRKLKFIRTKNKLRLGQQIFAYHFRLVQECGEECYPDLVRQTQAILIKHYKLKLRNIELSTGYNGDDFIQNYYTLRITLHNRTNLHNRTHQPVNP